MKTSVLIVLQIFILSFYNLIAAQASIEWEQTYGGSAYEAANMVQQTADGGFILAGWTDSSDGDISDNNGFSDYWIVKTDETGNLEWEQNFGGSSVDYLYDIQQVNGGGYIMVGGAPSDDGDVSGNYGGADYWVIKLDELGNKEWDKNYGGSSSDNGHAILQTTDGGYIIGGTSASTDEDISSNNGFRDYWIVKTDSDGTIEWEKAYGGSNDDEFISMSATSDGGYILIGNSRSSDGDVESNNGVEDIWVIKIDATGNKEWSQNYGGSDEDRPSSIQETKDGGYIISASTLSNDGDVGNNTGIYDYWIIKTNASGTIEWEKTYGGFDLDLGLALQQTDESGYIVAGWSLSDEGDVGDNYGNEDLWVLKLNASGNLEWEQNYGGSQPDQGYAMQRTTDAGFIIAGSSTSADGDVASNNGDSDFWLVKLAPCLPDNGITQNGEILTANAGGLSYQWLDCDNNLTPVPNANGQSFQPTVIGNYAVAITDGACTVNSECIDMTIVNTEDLTQELNIIVYPNPAFDWLHIEQTSQETNNIEVLDLSAKVIYAQSSSLNLTSISTAHWPSGVYIIKVVNATQTSVRKIVKE